MEVERDRRYRAWDAAMVFAFDGLELNEHTRELRRRGSGTDAGGGGGGGAGGGKAVAIELQPKVFDLLAFLVHNRARLVTRQELLEKVWEGTIVGDAAISRAIREVRRAVGDDGEAQRIIKTVHARGFRFVANVVLVEEDQKRAATGPASSKDVQSTPVVERTPPHLELVAPTSPSSLSSLSPSSSSPTSAQRPDENVEEKLAAELTLDPARGGADDFIGRADALRQLDALLTDIGQGTSGRTLLIAGEPGIGKTALIERFVRLSRARGISAHVARCSEADGVPALWPWEQLVRSIAAAFDDASAASAPPSLRAAAAEIATLLGPDAERFVTAASSARTSSASPSPSPSTAVVDESTSGAQARFRMHDGCVRFVAEAARTRPLVLVIDDLHLADTGSLALMHHFAPRIRSSRVAVIGTMRERGGQIDPALARGADALSRGSTPGTLWLQGLDNEEIAVFVHRQTGTPAAPHVAESLQRWTGGNPLFLSHVVDLPEVDTMRAGGGAGIAGAGASARSIVPVPKVLREAIDSTLDVLSPDARNVLEMAAVVGVEFRLVVVAKAMGIRSDDLLDAMGEALEYRIVRRVPNRVDTFTFVHGVLRDALYDRLSLGERARRHAAIGDALAAVHEGAKDEHAEELAHHFLRAASSNRADDAVTYATLAADHAVARAAFEHAASLYRAALDALPLATDRAEWRVRILLRLGSTLGRDGRIAEAGIAFRSAAKVGESAGGKAAAEARDGVRQSAANPSDSEGGAAAAPPTPFVRDVQALRDSFERIVGRAPQLTTRFYEILFERHPQVRALFKRNSPPVQAKMMNDTLMAIIDRLEDAPWLRASLAALGARHVDFGVTEEMYPFVGESLLATLAEAAGDDVWTPRVSEAWRQAFQAISAMMIEGARATVRRAS